MEEITRENYKSVDIKDLAFNPSFGSLTFNNAAKKLTQIKDWFVEFEDLNYQGHLPEHVVNDINNNIQRLIENLNWLRNFDIKTSVNAVQEHDNFENRIDSFYNDIFNNFAKHLSFLRQEAELKNTDKEYLRKEQKELQQLRKRSEEIVAQLETQLNALQNTKSEVESTSGEVAAARFGKHFESEVKRNKNEAEKWLERRSKYFTWLMGVIIANFTVFFYLFIASRANWWPYFGPRELFTIEYALVKFALLALLSYGLAFCSRNYNIASNLAASNQHRKNVAETLKDFLDAGPQPEDRAELVREGASAMFKHLTIGYVGKTDSKDDGPVSSIIHSIPTPKITTP